MTNKAYYHLPGLFEFYDLYTAFLPIFREHRDYFYDWWEIGSVYGAPADCIWGGGRACFGEHSPREVLDLMKEYNISSRLTFSQFPAKRRTPFRPKNAMTSASFSPKADPQNGVIIYSDLLFHI